MDACEQSVALTCANCGSANVSRRQVRSAFWEGERLVVVQDIPALVCDACAEQFYDDATVIALDRMRGEGFAAELARTELRVPVFSLGDRAVRKDEA